MGGRVETFPYRGPSRPLECFVLACSFFATSYCSLLSHLALNDCFLFLLCAVCFRTNVMKRD